MLGVHARSKIRQGDVYEEITAEMKEDGYDLLVLGAPLPARDGTLTLSGVTGRLLEELHDHPILVVRSEATARPVGATPLTPITLIKEIIE